MTAQNGWMEEALLLLHIALEEPAQMYNGKPREELVEAFTTRYGLTTDPVKEKLEKMRHYPNRSVFNLSVEIGRLVGLAHPHVPASECSDLIAEYLIESLDNRTLQCHLLVTDTFTVAKTVQAIDDYLTVRSPDWPTCKTIGDLPN